jgi:membrane protease YdiL (CAAX protease family)
VIHRDALRAVSSALTRLVAAMLLSAALAFLFDQLVTSTGGLVTLVRDVVPNAAALATLALTGKQRREWLPFGRPRAVALLLGAAGVLGASIALGDAIVVLGLEDVGTLKFLNDVLAQLGLGQRIVALVVLGLAAPIGEELFFRGLVLRRLVGPLGTRNALILSALLFGLVHLDPVQSPAAFLIGMYFGALVLETGSLWTSVVAHAINNSSMVIAPDVQGRAAPWIGLVLGTGVAWVAWELVRRRYSAPTPTAPTPS